MRSPEAIETYQAEFDYKWYAYFDLLDFGIKIRVSKKILKIREYPCKRHLKKSMFFVDEVGQYRIAYRVFEENELVRFYFVGTHKEYGRWYRQEF